MRFAPPGLRWLHASNFHAVSSWPQPFCIFHFSPGISWWFQHHQARTVLPGDRIWETSPPTGAESRYWKWRD